MTDISTACRELETKKLYEQALRNIASNKLTSSTNQDPAYSAGVRHGLAIAADMARRALDPDSPQRERQSPQGSVPAIGATTAPAARARRNRND